MAYRSRLQKVEEKRNFKKGAVLVFATLAIIGLSLKYGLKLLANLAIWVDDFRSINRTVDKYDNIPPAPPKIWTEYSATNSAQISIFGYAEPEAVIILTVNKNKIGELISSREGLFIFDNVSLTEGENEFNAVATDKANNTSHPSETFKIRLISKPPKLEVSYPVTGQKFSGKENRLEIKGQTDPEVRITVNNRTAVVQWDGNFLLSTTLSQGENMLIIKATDIAGNIAEKEITVTYTP